MQVIHNNYLVYHYVTIKKQKCTCARSEKPLGSKYPLSVSRQRKNL